MRGFVLGLLFLLPSVAAAQGPPKGHPWADGKRDPGPGDRERRPGDPSLRGGKGNWYWGVLYENQQYASTLTIQNDCDSRERVTIFVTNLPIEIPTTIIVPPKSQHEVPMTITMPPVPEELKKEGMGLTVEGTLVVWHPWTAKCLPKREQYDVDAYSIPPPPPPRGQPAQKNATAPQCRQVWELGMVPKGLADAIAAAGESLDTTQPKRPELEECTDELRDRAEALRFHLSKEALRAPGEWRWMPKPSEIQQMSLQEIVDFKARADAQLRGQPAPGAAVRPATDPASTSPATPLMATEVVASQDASRPETRTEDEARAGALRDEVGRLVAQDPRLRAPEGAELDARLETLSVRQLEALRDRLRARVKSSR